MKSDAELLRDYRRRGDESAFRQIVERYSGLIHGTALRCTGDIELAREVSQQVFLLLAKNAGRLYAGTGSLAGWLHRTAVLVSSSVKRRERRWGRMVKRYENYFFATAKTSAIPPLACGGEDWREALPLIDEGLLRLASKDREILRQHFWQGRTYQEIATEIGSTEAAVQRRASRAFVKLSAWLGKRRAAVPAGILTAGLATLSQPASGALTSAALTTQVLELLPQFPASSSWAWRVRETLAFGKMKFAAGFLTGAIVALLGGTGFAKGRAEAKEEQARRRLAADLSEAGAAWRILAQNAPPSAPPARRSLAEIVAEAADHYRNEADPAGAARGELLLEEIRPQEVPEALALLGGSIKENAIGLKMLPTLISRWKPAVTGDEAVLWLLANVHGDEAFRASLQPAVGAWAARDAEAARAWWHAREDLHKRADGFGIAHAIFIAYSPERRQALWQELPSLSYDEGQAAAELLTSAVHVPEARAEVLQRIREVPDERTRASLLKRTGKTLARTDPPAAAEWVRDLPLSDSKEAFMVRAETAADLMKQDPAQAMRVMLQSPAGALRDLWVKEFSKHLNSPGQ